MSKDFVISHTFRLSEAGPDSVTLTAIRETATGHIQRFEWIFPIVDRKIVVHDAFPDSLDGATAYVNWWLSENGDYLG